MGPFVRFFASLRLAIALLLLLVLASVLGTLIPQGAPASFYSAKYGALAGPIRALGLTGLYRSPGFLLLLLLFAANLAVCSAVRLPAKLRRAFRPALEDSAAALGALKGAERLRFAGDPAAAAARMKAVLAARGYRVAAAGRGGEVVLAGRKRRLGWFGSDLVHLGLLVVIAGALVSSIGRVRADLALRKGEAGTVPGGAFRVRLDEFTTERYPDGGVKDWKSAVSVLAGEDGAPPAARAVVEVNRPLRYGGFSFYQMSYGRDYEAATFRLAVKPAAPAAGAAKTLVLRKGEPAPFGLAGADTLVVSEFVPDFVMDGEGRIGSRSNEPRNPAVLVEGRNGEERVFATWVFAGFPEFRSLAAGSLGGLTFELAGFDAPEYSVLEAVRDPGVPWIWAGCLLAVAGLGLAFYCPPREIRAALRPGDGRTEAVAASVAAKGRDAAAAELRAVAEELRRPT